MLSLPFEVSPTLNLMGICSDRLLDQPPRVLHRLQVEERGRFGRGRGGADGKLMICYQGKVKNREREKK